MSIRMRMQMRARVVAVLSTFLFAALPAAAQGAPGAYPARPIRLIIPFAPGGPTDLFARLFAERLTAVSGQQVVVGNGTSTHLAAEMFKLKTGVDAVHVPYRGSGPAFLDMIAGRHAFMFDTIGASKPHVSSGKLSVVAVAGEKRSPTVPGVPTFAEAKIDGVLAFTWNMLLVPAGTPRTVVDALNRFSSAALSDPAFAKRTADLAIDLITDSTPESATAFVASETRRWAEVVKASGIKLEE